jgi:hypothetical protein
VHGQINYPSQRTLNLTNEGSQWLPREWGPSPKRSKLRDPIVTRADKNFKTRTGPGAVIAALISFSSVKQMGFGGSV